jgi:hypothetical protein
MKGEASSAEDVCVNRSPHGLHRCSPGAVNDACGRGLNIQRYDRGQRHVPGARGPVQGRIPRERHPATNEEVVPMTCSEMSSGAPEVRS